jgi:hypothetical protein
MGQVIDTDDPCWRTSSYSSSNGACVEVAILGESVLVRDSKDRTGPVLHFSIPAWRTFVAALTTGELTGDLGPRIAVGDQLTIR